MAAWVESMAASFQKQLAAQDFAGKPWQKKEDAPGCVPVNFFGPKLQCHLRHGITPITVTRAAGHGAGLHRLGGDYGGRFRRALNFSRAGLATVSEFPESLAGF